MVTSLASPRASDSVPFVIYVSSYDENSGGCIALHKLCHVLNAIGVPAFIFPEVMPGQELDGWLGNHGEAAFDQLVSKRFRLNESLNCPVLSGGALAQIRSTAEIVVVYPEVTKGNPLGAQNVVRWLLHDLGFHTGEIHISRGDFLVRYNALRQNVLIPGCRVSSSFLEVGHIPFEKYNLEGAAAERSGVAFCIRKGKGKEFVHRQEGAIMIDGMGHAEVASVFKRVRRFYSYDTASLYSSLAVLCGCESIVVPDPGVSIEAWCPDEQLRMGLHYGETGDLPSVDSIQAVERTLRAMDTRSQAQARAVVEEALEHFYRA